MLIVDWTPITESIIIPSFGRELTDHLEDKNGTVKKVSCSAWNLLYMLLVNNGYRPGVVAFTETGKPYFKDSDICFSISHSKTVCAAAVSDHPVGVDVEVIKKTYSLHLIERSLAESEKNSFDGDFTRLWCRKEAVAKMTGEGITGYPSHIDTIGYEFLEQQIEYDGLNYWLVAVSS